MQRKNPGGIESLATVGIKIFRFLLRLLLTHPVKNNNIITIFFKKKAKVLKYNFPFCFHSVLFPFRFNFRGKFPFRGKFVGVDTRL